MDIELIRIISACVMLVIATFYDLWKREIHDYLWVIFGALSVVLLLLDQNIQEELILIAISMMVAPLALIAWKMGFFGGADALSLIVLAALAPSATIAGQVITPFTTLLNAAILSMIPLIWNVTRNILQLLQKENIFEGFDEPKHKKILAMFLGTKVKNPKYGFSIEETINGKKKFRLGLHNADNEEFSTIKNTWITPGLPYMIFILAGFIIQLIWGDIIFNFIRI